MYDPSNYPPAWPQTSQTPSPEPQSPPGKAERMPVAEARRRAGALKRWTLAGATLAFCALSGLAASHITGVTAASGSSGSSPTTVPSHQDDHGSFFPGNGNESDDGDHQSGGVNFGSGGPFQPPASTSGGS